MLKVWGRVNSSNVQKVMWCIGELGLPHQRLEAGREFGVVGEPHYRAMNPNGKIPTIQDDGLTLWESNAICRHLARKAGRLMPPALADQARVDMWMDWQQTELGLAFGPVFIGLVRTPESERNHAFIEERKKASIAAMSILDSELEKRLYVVGNTFTVADIPFAVTAYRYFQLIPESPKLGHLERWYGDISQRPAFRQHVSDIPLT